MFARLLIVVGFRVTLLCCVDAMCSVLVASDELMVGVALVTWLDERLEGCETDAEVGELFSGVLVGLAEP